MEYRVTRSNIPSNSYDVIIVGAGPAGCTCAYKLSGKGLKICIVEKSIFPRDKVCGDAVSPDVVNQLHWIDIDLGKRFHHVKNKNITRGIRFIAPNSKQVDLEFMNPKFEGATGFVIKRLDFDNFMFDQVKDLPDVHILQNHQVHAIESSNEKIVVSTEGLELSAHMLIGADGSTSIVKKRLSNKKIDREHYSAGLRQYYENVKGFDSKGLIELHFYKDILPGYFWIFPLENNQANVGIGMLSSEISKRGIDLKKKLSEIIKSHPNVKDRFENAIAL